MVDQEVTIQLPEVRENEENAKRKIAIIGAGPAGLSCAYFLARLGYRPVVFESESCAGGMLTQTIPSYRMPRNITEREIRMIEGMGVDILTGKKLGRDFSLSSLRDEGYEAVFIGIGAPTGICLQIPGADSGADGITDAMKFLRDYNLKGKAKVGKKAVVVGGGNAAIDAARTAVRMGADVYRHLSQNPGRNAGMERGDRRGAERRRPPEKPLPIPNRFLPRTARHRRQVHRHEIRGI
jgi:NADH-quinone oxidoreductase subunit F